MRGKSYKSPKWFLTLFWFFIFVYDTDLKANTCRESDSFLTRQIMEQLLGQLHHITYLILVKCCHSLLVQLSLWIGVCMGNIQERKIVSVLQRQLPLYWIPVHRELVAVAVVTRSDWRNKITLYFLVHRTEIIWTLWIAYIR